MQRKTRRCSSNPVRRLNVLSIAALTLLLRVLPLSAAAPTARNLSTALDSATFDPQQCFRVRNIRLEKEDVRIYLTEGFLLFARPVEGKIMAAYFYAENEAGDGEVLVVPPDAAERTTLARFTGAPNLDEHFRGALLLFTDRTGDELATSVKESGAAPSQEMGTMLASQYNSLLKNLFKSFEIRLVSDLILNSPKRGLFFMATAGSKLGNFDIAYDPTAHDQVNVGQVTYRNETAYFDVWTSFAGRSVRKGLTPKPEMSTGVKIKNFDIQSEITPEFKLKSATKIKFQPTGQATRLMQFECSKQVRIHSAKLNGRDVEFFQRESLRSNLIRGRDGDVFLVIPSEPLVEGQTAEILFEHEADVIRPAGNGVFYVGARGSWYPQSGIQFVPYDLTFRYPKNLQVVSAGTLVEDRTEESTRITRRRVEQPVRMVGFNLGNYGKASASLKGLSVEVFANKQLEAFLTRRSSSDMPPPLPSPFPRRTANPQLPAPLEQRLPQANPFERAERLAKEIVDIFSMFRDRFGPPPVPQLEISPVPGTFGQGFPGMIYLSTLAYLNRDELPPGVRDQQAQLFYTDLLHAHEVAHQWWGNRVVAIGANDEWMMEALANYSALMQLERKKGVKALDSVLEEYKKRLLSKLPSGETMESTGPIKLGLRLENSQAPNAWRTITYEKGAWILHMLRRRMGDQAFFSALREICINFEAKPFSTSDFQAVAVKHLPKQIGDSKLEDFFEHWVNGTGIPELELKWKLQGKGTALKVVGSIHQKNVEETFTTLVPMEIQFARGVKSRIEWIRTDGTEAEFEIKVPATTVKVVLDPAGSVLAVRK